MMWNYGVDGWSWLWMSGMMVLFWGGLIVLVVWAVRSFSGTRQKGDPALDVLRRRLAAGEITPDEFQKTKTELGA